MSNLTGSPFLLHTVLGTKKVISFHDKRTIDLPSLKADMKPTCKLVLNGRSSSSSDTLPCHCRLLIMITDNVCSLFSLRKACNVLIKNASWLVSFTLHPVSLQIGGMLVFHI